MKTILIMGVIIECMILIILTVVKKWTRKVFVIVAVVTMAFCAGAGILAYQTTGKDKAADQREYLYMAARLLEENYPAESLEALSVVSDEDSSAYRVRALRALAYNMNEAYSTAKAYLDDSDDETELLILSSSVNQETVDDEIQNDIITATLGLIAATEAESLQWETEMKVLYMGFKLDEEELANVDSVVASAKAYIQEKQYEDAYNLMTADEENLSLKNAIIISSMYVKNYNNRLLSDTDSEYARLWNEAVELQADLNVAAVSLTDDETSEEYREYQKNYAKYQIAVESLNIESAKRAINFLMAIETVDEEYEIGYQLQLARLYFISNQTTEAEKCLEQIFASDSIDEEKWLGREVSDFKEALILYISNPSDTEYAVLFDGLMKSLYQSVFEDDNTNGFREFVVAWLKEFFGGLTIKSVNADHFPQIVVEVSVTDEELDIAETPLLLTDTKETIQNYTLEMVEVSDLSLSLVLDRSGSMEGTKLSESKNAIRNCIAQMSDDIQLSFVTFESSAELMCNLTDSKYLVMNLVENVTTTGGTNISDGLATAIESLKSASGKKVIILLSDGYDGTDSQAKINSVLEEAISNDIVVYTIGLEGCDEEYLENISSLTGGLFIMVTNTASLNSTYQDIQNSLMNSYTITYSVTGEEEVRSLQIQVSEAYVEAKKEYSLTEEYDEADHDEEENEVQKAGYYKQTGGTAGGR